MCDQQSLRSACAYAQSDQSLCLSLEYSMIVKLLTEHHLEFLSLKGGCSGSSESTLVKMSNCWKTPAAAQMIIVQIYIYAFGFMMNISLLPICAFCTMYYFIALTLSLLITFANCLNPDQAQQNVRPDLDPNCMTLWWYSGLTLPLAIVAICY